MSDQKDPLQLCGFSRDERHQLIASTDPAIDWVRSTIGIEEYKRTRDTRGLVFFDGLEPARFWIRPIDNQERAAAMAECPVAAQTRRINMGVYVYRLARFAVTAATGVRDAAGNVVDLQWVHQDGYGRLLAEESVRLIAIATAYEIMDVVDRIHEVPADLKKKSDSSSEVKPTAT